jgi:hypothetical protein
MPLFPCGSCRDVEKARAVSAGAANIDAARTRKRQLHRPFKKHLNEVCDFLRRLSAFVKSLQKTGAHFGGLPLIEEQVTGRLYLGEGEVMSLFRAICELRECHSQAGLRAL